MKEDKYLYEFCKTSKGILKELGATTGFSTASEDYLIVATAFYKKGNISQEQTDDIFILVNQLLLFLCDNKYHREVHALRSIVRSWASKKIPKTYK